MMFHVPNLCWNKAFCNDPVKYKKDYIYCKILDGSNHALKKFSKNDKGTVSSCVSKQGTYRYGEKKVGK